jgi:hypothetical protein
MAGICTSLLSTGKSVHLELCRFTEPLEILLFPRLMVLPVNIASHK